MSDSEKNPVRRQMVAAPHSVRPFRSQRNIFQAQRLYLEAVFSTGSRNSVERGPQET